MVIVQYLRRLALAAALAGLSGGAIVALSLPAALVAGALNPVMAQVSAEFDIALEPYGTWRRHPRYGEVWSPSGVPRDWRPYEYGRWVYTDEWGWYWVSDESEQDWGWVTFHYGRWVHDRRSWFWVPGDEWAPAWVDWRHGGEYVGWSALPPDDLIESYSLLPALWILVPGRYMLAPRWRTYIVPPQRRVVVLRSTRVVNLSLIHI